MGCRDLGQKSGTQPLFLLPSPVRARSSVVEHLSDKEKAEGSIPSARTIVLEPGERRPALCHGVAQRHLNLCPKDHTPGNIPAAPTSRHHRFSQSFRRLGVGLRGLRFLLICLPPRACAVSIRMVALLPTICLLYNSARGTSAFVLSA